MTEGELQLALFSSNDWSEESRQVRRLAGRERVVQSPSGRHPRVRAPAKPAKCRSGFWKGQGACTECLRFERERSPHPKAGCRCVDRDDEPPSPYVKSPAPGGALEPSEHATSAA